MTKYYPGKAKYKSPVSLIQLKNIIILAGFLAGVSLFYACEEKPTSIGMNLLPGSDNVMMEGTDTLKVESYTMYVDSVISANRTYSYLGGLYDPYFGSTFTDFVSQMRLTKKWPGGAPIVDSVKLFMPITGVKGEFGFSQSLLLYEISEQLDEESVYYSNRVPSTSMFIGEFELPELTKDSARVFEIDLPVSFGSYLLRDTTKLNQEGGANDFRSFFRGIYFTVAPTLSPGKGSVPDVPQMMTLSFSVSYLTIRVYYHLATALNLTYDFIINSNSIRYNRYLHDFSAAEAGREIAHINDGIEDTASYLQGFYGAYTRLKIPQLETLKSIMPLSVNKTKITLSAYLDNNIYKTSTIPPNIYMSYFTEDGTRNIVPDYLLSSSFFDGSLNTTTKKYTFNLSSFVQEYLNGNIPEPELDLYLMEGEYRNVILKGKNSTSPVKFEFVFTRF